MTQEKDRNSETAETPCKEAYEQGYEDGVADSGENHAEEPSVPRNGFIDPSDTVNILNAPDPWKNPWDDEPDKVSDEK